MKCYLAAVISFTRDFTVLGFGEHLMNNMSLALI